MSNPARVCVLLATHNGERYLEQQLESILNQEGVELRVLASDDASRDGTLELLHTIAARDPRVTVLPQGTFGSPSGNFYRLIDEADLDWAEFIGFADQDDVWLPGKLARHATILRDQGVDGVSSNVVAFDEHGRESLIRKDTPQRLADYVFETPGPGSSMLVSRRLMQLIREQLQNSDSPARKAWSHDLLFYALARAAGCSWYVDPEPTVAYRQHGENAIGANGTLKAGAKRLELTASRWHRKLVQIVVESCIHVATPAELPRLQWLHEVLSDVRGINRLRLARRAGEFRRTPRDRVILATLMVTGLW